MEFVKPVLRTIAFVFFILILSFVYIVYTYTGTVRGLISHGTNDQPSSGIGPPEEPVSRDEASAYIYENRADANFWIDKNSWIEIKKQGYVDGIFIKKGIDPSTTPSTTKYFAWASFDKNHQQALPDYLCTIPFSKTCVCEPCCDIPIGACSTLVNSPVNKTVYPACIRDYDPNKIGLNLWISANAIEKLLDEKSVEGRDATGIFIKKGFKEYVIDVLIAWPSFEGAIRNGGEPGPNTKFYWLLTRSCYCKPCYLGEPPLR